MHRRHHPHRLHYVALAAIAATATLCTTACAQATPTPNVMVERRITAPEALASHQLLTSISLGAERTVKGAPYCADAVRESVQWLPDATGAPANRIVQRQLTKLCRDGEGRTRQEVEHDGKKLVHLNDPVSRERWVLDPERKSARRSIHLGSASAEVMAHDWREFATRMRDWARGQAEHVRAPGAPGSPAAPVPPEAPMPPMPALITPNPAELHNAIREVQVRVLRGPDADMLATPPEVSFRTQQFAPRGAGVVTALPAQDIEGHRANGERTTWTVEAGKLGNEKPIVSSREVWTSPELMLTLRSVEIDPRRGETHYKLQNLKRGEPDAALMRVPADYSKPRSAGAAGEKPAS